VFRGAPDHRADRERVSRRRQNAFPDDVKQCRDAGMSDFLAKPLRRPAMVAAILRATTPAVAACPALVA
jgi:hypothetical protein